MFQTFEATTAPDQGPPRLEALRTAYKAHGFDGFLIPRADAYQGEYVAPCDARLAWLTGFTGSAGFCAVLDEIAGVFVDGRYRVQVKEQVATTHFTPVDWPEVKLADWLKEQVKEARIAYDPWLYTKGQIAAVKKGLIGTGISLHAAPNFVDQVWSDRPSAPQGKVEFYALELSGEKSSDKRARIAEMLRNEKQPAAVLTLPDSICWLLNIRGTDIPRNPVVHCMAILYDTGKLDLFIDPAKLEGLPPDPNINALPPASFEAALTQLSGPVRVDRDSAPLAVSRGLKEAGVEIAYAEDPCILPKACKNATEIEGARAAHLRDAHAMVNFLAWLDAQPVGSLTEIDVAKALEGFRADTNALRDISFETISGANANGAIVHYRVTEDTNAPVDEGLLLVDSGGQYVDGTTDITRTIAIGQPTEEQRKCFTLVLQGMIAISRARFPRGLAGRDLDALARAPLWAEGMDYDHGTGHGVGAYLSVHEGPQRLSRVSEVALQPGMILSNEPGYYREGAFGIRIENLIVVEDAPEAGDKRDQLSFETLTYVPIDRRLIVTEMLSPAERAWIDAYHAEVATRLSVSGATAEWLMQATQPL
ncbi:MAG: aminopeptidase P family protein [Pseudomonadota bacterium]